MFEETVNLVTTVDFLTDASFVKSYERVMFSWSFLVVE